MALTITEHTFDPDDPDGPLRRLSTPCPASAAGYQGDELSSWVEPDYSTIASEADLCGHSPFRDWPGPPLVMPAGLLPDGKPHGPDEMENSYRIEGVRPRNEAEADACVWAYWGQQNILRDELGLPWPTRSAPTFTEQDTPETLAAIAEIHRQERERRRRQTG